jgi:transposase
MGTTCRQFTDEFKREAVGLLASSGRPLRQIAQELGIAASRLRAWRNRGDGGMRDRRGAPIRRRRPRMPVRIWRRKNSPGAVDQQLAKIAIASLGDPGETGLAACRYLPGHEAEPRGKVSSACECLAFADCRGKSRCVQHADSGDSRQTPRGFIVLRASCKLIIQGGDASIENPPFFPHVLDQHAEPLADCEALFFAQHRIELAFEVAPPLGDDYAPLQENGAQLIDQGGALPHQPIAGAMQRLHVQLLFTFQLDETHGRPCGCLGDRLRISIVVLLRLDVRTYSGDISRTSWP